MYTTLWFCCFSVVCADVHISLSFMVSNIPTDICSINRYRTLTNYHLARLLQWQARFCAQSFVHVDMEENIKAPRHWPLWGDSSHKGPVTRKMFPYDDVIMIKWTYSLGCAEALWAKWTSTFAVVWKSYTGVYTLLLATMGKPVK